MLSYEFVKEEIEKEGYKLISTEYINNSEKLKIQCDKGHEYEVTYGNFQQGQRCLVCSGLKKLTYEFIKEEIEKETGYELISTEYLNSKEKLKIKCDVGHVYEANYNAFQQGSRCIVCAGSQTLTYEFVKEQVEKENGYKLLSTEYFNNKTKLKIQCVQGHQYEVLYNTFQRGIRCPDCSGLKRLTYEFVKEQVQKENGYKLLSTEYFNNRGELKIQCEKGHKYETSFDNFQQGRRCSQCFRSFSKAEREISSYVQSLGFTVLENTKTIISPLELDIVIPEKKIAIEYCGLYWHSDIHKDKNYHVDKMVSCNQSGYRLITIFEDEWLNKQELVKFRFKYILGAATEKVFARKCTIRKIDNRMAREFIDRYHIQGYAMAIINLGAFQDLELVSVMTFAKPNLSKGMKPGASVQMELSRFCSSKRVIGIASKFMAYFHGRYPEVTGIYSFSDLRWNTGNVYTAIGMKKIARTSPNYFYFKNRILKRHHRFNFRKDVLSEKLQTFDPNKTEYDNMLANDFFRIWDCGNEKFELIFNGTK